MSKQEKRSRGKRPRYEDRPSREAPQVHGFAPINYQSQLSPTFTDSPEQSQQPPRAAFLDQPQSSQRAHLPLAVTTQAPPGKVAIPALRTPQTADSSKNFKKGRTPHACDYCRKAKAGCTGEQPCSRCRSAGVDCVYGDGKRVRDRKRVSIHPQSRRKLTDDRQMSKLSKETDSLSQHNADVTEALRRIRLDTHLSTDDMRAAIDEVLAMVSSSSFPALHTKFPDTKSSDTGRERKHYHNFQARFNGSRRTGR
jgi:Fungal Zn(2)-Cys(6) binuclear cluster domain